MYNKNSFEKTKHRMLTSFIFIDEHVSQITNMSTGPKTNAHTMMFLPLAVTNWATFNYY